ncbi:alcohol dehydrogenase catalytic domain-containing protein [Anabaena cylindrica FACHB-243]|uniref:L-iditol 2-dehydrogenase n=1 Tax=Anabaena cylindrica (strain ATCC 27899 / PCC 7122) TaxID=272123 RepID=K9ZFQ5_ANACC|nr:MULTISPECIES: zinc-binding dehydrogenase [Anabaena]AFZ58026.1 L-iditol 2-dehydrogenase [Anabaena cylindrica PCC 7122]MBD2419199.1 alcohol dehydrogenase catalytic domain-containing protein [Anabaena cylindrica FACHB-243]MBY5285252.1 alcohol dehydrogenase catalytic domain-containing protein [Anabaena sp. CCAP 1446/1C]MBY5311519.1 alcohol dehydrogenase catalytic domain-containing protein [Anabaena sp. CCAP 1446/1C]MCM2409671.1 alcohol dehydrogenase catalytic domain-containing protein [Anabaena
MLAALLYGQEDLRLETVPEPTPADGEVVIKVGAATTCGTDLKVWRRGSHAKMLTLPTLFGHEAAGTIVAVGAGVHNWQVGNRIVANNSAPCMKCFFCQLQEYSLCPNLIWNNGTFAEYLKIPAAIVQQNMLRIPDELPFELAAMTEPLACVLHGVGRSHVKPQDRVVVLGDGAIGLMFVGVLAAQTKAEVLLWGGNDQRLEIGKKLGAAKIFNYHQVADIPSVVKELTAGWGADVVIEATGVPSVWEKAIACARPGATVNLFGGCPKDTTITVNTEQLHYSELTLKGVFHNTPEYVRSALSLIASRKIPFELLISEHRPLKDLEQVFADMKARKVIKVAMLPC